MVLRHSQDQERSSIRKSGRVRTCEHRSVAFERLRRFALRAPHAMSGHTSRRNMACARHVGAANPRHIPERARRQKAGSTCMRARFSNPSSVSCRCWTPTMSVFAAIQLSIRARRHGWKQEDRRGGQVRDGESQETLAIWQVRLAFSASAKPLESSLSARVKTVGQAWWPCSETSQDTADTHFTALGVHLATHPSPLSLFVSLCSPLSPLFFVRTQVPVRKV